LFKLALRDGNTNNYNKRALVVCQYTEMYSSAVQRIINMQ